MIFRVFVEVEPNRHAFFAAMCCAFQSLSLGFLGGYLGFHLFPIGMVIGQRRMDLRERKMRNSRGDFLRGVA